MRLFCYLNEIGRPYIPAFVIIPDLNARGMVDFLMDTGSDITRLGMPDAKKLKIDYAKLPDGGIVSGVGTASSKIVVNPIELTFLTELNYVHQERLRGISIVLKEIPSVLGRDIMQTYRFVMEDRHHLYLER